MQATLLGIGIGSSCDGTPRQPPIQGADVQATGLGIGVGVPTLGSPGHPPRLGIMTEAEDTAYSGHSARAEALNCQSDSHRGGIFGSGRIAQMRLLPRIFES